MATVSRLVISIEAAVNTNKMKDEVMYKLNYMEPNRRSGSNPWSARHIGVYHRHDQVAGSDLYILVHCSKKSILHTKLINTHSEELDLSMLKTSTLHEVILDCYICYWRPYLRWLGENVSSIVSV